MPKVNNHHFYSSAIKKYGTTPKGVNWISAKTQKLRFKAIAKFLPKDLDSFSVVDAGCGFGDFYTFLKTKPKNYIGLDIHEDMCAIASNQTGEVVLQKDICKDLLPMGDFYICSGAMNVLTSFETHLFIQNCFKSSKIAFIFNILYGSKESQTYNYMSKDEVLSIAKELKVRDVGFNEGYLEDDITVVFYK
ncbi:MAG: class I SAM-dependent methyltransferase [Sulfurimonas sp.]|jgi:SAM-dependent methyltransferase|nr:class I SAM-dependent methyltransferase [Sulfurimonadaceae bacterium]